MSDINKTVEHLLAQEESWAANPAEFRGLPSSLAPINRVTRGYQPARLYAYGARTENGKTAFALQESFGFANYIIQHQQETGIDLGKILFINPEMSLEQVLQRYVSSRCPAVRFDDIFTGQATEEERHLWRSTLKTVLEYQPFVVVHAGGSYSIGDIESEINDMKNLKQKVAALVIDYIQLIRGDGDDQRVSTMRVSQKLKQMSIQYNIPVIVMSQLRNPQVHFYRGERFDEESVRPRIFDMAESSDIQKSADFAAVIYNPEDTYNEKEYRAATIFVDKNRGPHAEIGLLFYGARGEYVPTDVVIISGETRK